MANYPILHIVTGPPGSGKSTWAAERNLPVYDNDLGNRRGFIHADPKVESCLTVTAPSKRDKDYWVSLAKSNGYQVKLYCIWISKMEAFTRMKSRSGSDTLLKDGTILPAGTQSNTADRWVHRWYKNYQRHPLEQRISNDRRTVPHAC